MNHLQPIDSDLQSIKSMKERLRKYLNEKLPITVDHLIASYLTPGLKTNFLSKYHDQSLVKNAKEYLKSLYDGIEDDAAETSNVPPEKKQKRDDMLASYYTATTIPKKYNLSELERYRVYVVSGQDCNETPLGFWNRNISTFPKLIQIAMDRISIPATSVKSEQNFSAAGRLVSDRRTCLNSDTIDSILLVKSNTSYVKL